MNRLHTIWRDVNSSLWFVPTLMVAAAMLLAYGLVRLDVGMHHAWAKDYPLLFGAGASGARGMLTTIAGSMMTVASLGFSLTLSTLGQVSSQYASRVLRNFMSSRVNQVVLGAEYELRAQRCADLQTMPVKDAAIDWPQAQSPYQALGKIVRPAQDAFSPARRVYADDVLSFNPFRCLPEHRPLGSINRVRIKAYESSAQYRHTTNAQPRTEPTDISQLPD